MADPKNSTPPARHIRWQEVIELDPQMQPKDRAILVQNLEQVEHSKIGQTKFSQLRTAETMIPRDPTNPKQLSKDALATLTSSVSPYGIAYEHPNPHLSRRHELPKVFISTIGADELPTPFGKHIARHAGMTYNTNNAMVLHLPTLLHNQLETMTANGQRQRSILPLRVMLVHELQHLVDAQTRFWVKKDAPLPLPCLEQRAVDTEGAFIDETMPHTPRRYRYTESQSEVLAPLERIRQDLRAEGLHQVALTPQSLDMYAKRIKNVVPFEGNCANVTRDDIVLKTRRLLEDYGVSPAAFQLSRELDLGLVNAPSLAANAPTDGKGKRR